MSDSDEVIISRLRLSSPKDAPTVSTSTAKRKPVSKLKNSAGSMKSGFARRKSGAKGRNRPAKQNNNKGK